ncbi:MAG: tyrosine-type recombinase/integrase [Steroidobacteraceae bacterium]
MEPPPRLTDARLQALLKQPRTKRHTVFDGSVPGLGVRLSLGGGASWTLMLRVAGEGGTNRHGRALRGEKIRVALGQYPTVSLHAARAKANVLIEQAKKGVNPKAALQANATAGGLTVRALSDEFLENHVRSRNLDSASNYENALKVHINPKIGDKLAELLTREDVRAVMNAARVKRKRPAGQRGPALGGIEAARSAMSILRHMFSWAMDEGTLKRKDNPVSKITKNLPNKTQGDVVLSTAEARIVWDAAQATGYPFGTHVQLMLLTGCRLDEWASARVGWVDLNEGLIVIPREGYKSDHVHVVPLVRQALEIIKVIPERRNGDYLLSSDGGRTPISGISKYYRTRLQSAIIANTGGKLAKEFTSHDLRRTVATRLAEALSEQGEKLVKRVLGHSDGSVTAIYNRYAYVREMRIALENWATELTVGGCRAPHVHSASSGYPPPERAVVDSGSLTPEAHASLNGNVA